MNTIRHRSRLALIALLAAVLGAGLAVSLAFGRDAAAAPGRGADAGIVVIDTNLGYQRGAAAGSGMVLSPSGEVLTNNHVIQGATAIRVVVPQTGRSYRARVVGYDVTADTAVLKLQGASGLATVSLGNSSALRVGQAVRAVGNAGGTGSLTTVRGKVTGLGKAITARNDQGGSERLTGLVETNAGLQPGDSGGPLLNASGQVVGMDTAASTSSGGFYFRAAARQAYAIPIDHALALARQIEAGRSSATVHVGGTPFLGIEVASVPHGYGAYEYGNAPAAGAVVAGVFAGSPAARAGLGSGDEIAAVDGHPVSSPNTLVKQLLRRQPGARIALTWIDGFGNRQTATVTLASGPPQ